MQSVLLKAPVCVCWCDSKGHGHSVLGKSSGNTELLLLKNRSDLAEVTRSPKIWDSCQDTPQVRGMETETLAFIKNRSEVTIGFPSNGKG